MYWDVITLLLSSFKLFLISGSSSDLFITGQQYKMCTNTQRKLYITQMCKKYGSSQIQGKRLLIDDKYKMLQCSIAKSACTTWKGLWENANFKNRHNSHKNFSEIEANSVHTTYLWKAGLKFDAIENIYQYTNFLKFVVVRNPFDRIYSAYLNAMFRKPESPGPSQNIKIYLEKLNIRNNRPRNVTFKQFLELILNETDSVQQRKYKNDRHWKPIAYQCDLCNIEYDHIIRVETMKYDSGPILTVLGYPKDYLLLKDFKLNSYRTEQENVNKPQFKTSILDVYKSIPLDLYKKFIQMYWYDLHMLGYDFDLEHNQTVCKCQMRDGTVCC